MHLTHVSVPVADPDRAARWYLDVLGIDDDVLTLREGPVMGVHHLAFLVSAASFAASKEWLQERVVLTVLDGQDEFEGSASWNSRSLYFTGPEQAVLELIARRDLPDRSGTGAGGSPILGLSEVGVAVPDVLAAVGRLQTEVGVPAYGATPTATFAAVGDVHGMLILVAQGRRWFPTQDSYAGAAAVDVDAVRAGVPGTCPVGGGHLRVATAP